METEAGTETRKRTMPDRTDKRSGLASLSEGAVTERFSLDRSQTDQTLDRLVTNGRLCISIDDDGDAQGEFSDDTPVGDGVNSNSLPSFDNMSEAANKGTQDARLCLDDSESAFGDAVANGTNADKV